MAGTKLTRNLPNNAYQAAVNADGPSLANPYATINDLPTATGNILISGGASYSGTGMVFDVSVLVYLIEGIEYTSAETSVTLANGDATNPRFDAIVVDENSLVSVVQGTPAADPITPSIGADQVLVQYVLIGAGATTPTVTTEFIYQDFSPVYWSRGVAGINSTADFNSPTPVPPQGTSCVLASLGQYGSRRGVSFSTGTPVSRSEYVVLSFKVNFPQSFVEQGVDYFRMWAYGDNTPGDGPNLGWVELGNYVDFSLADTWQLVNIPTGLFNQTQSVDVFGYFNWTVWRAGQGLTPPTAVVPNVEFALDDIKLQTGYGPQINVATVDILSEGDVIGSTSRLNFRSASGLANRISQNTPDNSITISPNTPKIVSTAAIVGSWVIDATNTSIAQVTGQAVSPLLISNPTGASLRDGQQLILKIKDNGFAVTLSWGPAWKAFTGVTLPSSTGTGKWQYITAYYDQGSGDWHVIDVKEE